MKTKSCFLQSRKKKEGETFHSDLMFEFIIVAYTTQADYIFLRVCLFFLIICYFRDSSVLSSARHDRVSPVVKLSSSQDHSGGFCVPKFPIIFHSLFAKYLDLFPSDLQSHCHQIVSEALFCSAIKQLSSLAFWVSGYKKVM